MATIEYVLGDITEQEVDVIVNAVNSIEDAARMARAATADAPVEVIRFVLFDQAAYNAYGRP